MIELADGLWRWTARHPEWHSTSEFGASVGSYVAHDGGRTVLIDPLLPDEVVADLDEIIAGEVVVAITIPYHVRDSATAVARWGGVVSGHPDLQRRLPQGTPFDSDAGLRWHSLKRGKEYIINSLHVVTGASVLVTTLILTLRAHRARFGDVLGPAGRVAGTRLTAGPDHSGAAAGARA